MAIGAEFYQEAVHPYASARILSHIHEFGDVEKISRWGRTVRIHFRQTSGLDPKAVRNMVGDYVRNSLKGIEKQVYQKAKKGKGNPAIINELPEPLSNAEISVRKGFGSKNHQVLMIKFNRIFEKGSELEEPISGMMFRYWHASTLQKALEAGLEITRSLK